MMDGQQIFNFVVSGAGFLLVYIFTRLTMDVAKLEEELKDLPHVYVAKDDYKDDIKEIKDILKQIFEKLDSKADK
jgi:hypothetical protein